MHWRILARRVLGREGTFLLRNIVSSLAFYLRLIPPANIVGRENGISAITCTYNEEDWIEVSLLSLKDLVNEIVVLDSSTDRNPDIIEELHEKHNIPIRMYRIPLGDMVYVRNLGLSIAKYKWILIWDADFILRDDSAPLIRELLESLDERKYYLIYWPHICLDGDLWHQDPKSPLHVEHWLFTWNPKLRYKRVGHHDSLIAQLAYYNVIHIRRALSFHLRTVRSPKRLLYRHYRWLMRREGLEGKSSLDEYVKKRILEDFGTEDIDLAANLYFQRHLLNLAKYQRDVYGDYPQLLREYVKRKFNVEL